MSTTRRATGKKTAGPKANGAKRPSGTVRPTRRTDPANRERALPAEQLVTGILDVKTALDQAVARFSARVSGRLGEVLRALENPEPLAKGTVKAMVERVREVRLKPGKGRPKDLIRLQDLAEDLIEMLPGH